jgi:hypothetical protein
VAISVGPSKAQSRVEYPLLAGDKVNSQGRIKGALPQTPVLCNMCCTVLRQGHMQ